MARSRAQGRSVKKPVTQTVETQGPVQQSPLGQNPRGQTAMDQSPLATLGGLGVPAAPIPTSKVRLDALLAKTYPHLSRMRWQAHIRAGNVLMNQKPVTDPGLRVFPQESFTFCRALLQEPEGGSQTLPTPNVQTGQSIPPHSSKARDLPHFPPPSDLQSPTGPTDLSACPASVRPGTASSGMADSGTVNFGLSHATDGGVLNGLFDQTQGPPLPNQEADQARAAWSGDLQPLMPVAMDLDILYEDEALLILNKPWGLVVHPGAGTQEPTLVHGLLARGTQWSDLGGSHKPGIVHRLDKDTSGLMVVAKTDLAHRRLSDQFAQRTLEKLYWAFVWGTPQPPFGRMDQPLGRDARHRLRQTVDPLYGRPALTKYRTLASAEGMSLLECQLCTGRTHQIRVHCAWLGHPLVGDRVYGHGHGHIRQALHARALRLNHPLSGESLSFEAPLAPDLVPLYDKLCPSAFKRY